MKPMSFGIIFGILIILFGVSIIVNVIFHVHIPVFKIALAVFFIWLGIKMLVGGSWSCHRHNVADSNNVIFGDNYFTLGKGQSRNFNVIFGKGTLDLSDVDSTDLEGTIEVSTIFGEMTVILPDSFPARIKANSAFGEVRLPDRSTSAFGNTEYRTPDFDVTRTAIDMNVSAIFGSTKVKR
jgi:predicted membrane protein